MSADAKGTTGAADSVDLGAQFEVLSDLIAAREPGLADRLVRFAAAAVPHADHAGVTLLVPRRAPTTLAATDRVASRADRIQYEEGEGPCLAAAAEYLATEIRDMELDAQWPRFAQRCSSETHISSSLSVRLAVKAPSHAALNLYSRTADVFTSEDAAVAAVLSPYLTIAVERDLHDTDLAVALESNRQIATAVGILMARGTVTKEAAFEQLRIASQTLNRKVRDIAEHVERTGALPDALRRDR